MSDQQSDADDDETHGKGRRKPGRGGPTDVADSPGSDEAEHARATVNDFVDDVTGDSDTSTSDSQSQSQSQSSPTAGTRSSQQTGSGEHGSAGDSATSGDRSTTGGTNSETGQAESGSESVSGSKDAAGASSPSTEARSGEENGTGDSDLESDQSTANRASRPRRNPVTGMVRSSSRLIARKYADTEETVTTELADQLEELKDWLDGDDD